MVVGLTLENIYLLEPLRSMCANSAATILGARFGPPRYTYSMCMCVLHMWIYICVHMQIRIVLSGVRAHLCMRAYMRELVSNKCANSAMGWLRSVGSINL